MTSKYFGGIMKNVILFGLCCGAVIACLFYVEIDKIQLLNLHNDARSGKAMALSMQIELDDAAQDHADWMAKNDKLSHQGENRSQVWDRIQKKFTTCGENIAAGQPTPEAVVRSWINSPPHYRNMIDKDYKYVGFGIAKARDGTYYWCAVFSD
jgi:uncharacterized protein YkwD